MTKPSVYAENKPHNAVRVNKNQGEIYVLLSQEELEINFDRVFFPSCCLGITGRCAAFADADLRCRNEI